MEVVPPSKYFLIKSTLSGLVLEVAEGRQHPGAPVTVWMKLDGDHPRQQWYLDQGTQTLRTRLNDFCLDLDGERNACVNPYDPDSSTQQWHLRDDTVALGGTQDVLDVANNNPDPGARITVWQDHGATNQRWSIEHIPTRFFVIKSKMHGKVMDVKGWLDGEEPIPNQKVIMYSQKDPPEDNQQWYEDSSGVIRCKLGHFAIDSSDTGTIRANPYNPHDPAHQWIFSGEVIVNRMNPGQCLDIKKKNRKNEAELCAFDYRNQRNQQWEKEYL